MTENRITGLDIERVEAELRPLLFDLSALALQGKQLHWNVEGRRFRSVHLELDEIVVDARLWTDLVAERLITIGANADGQAGDVARESSLADVSKGRISDTEALNQIAERLNQTALRSRTSAINLADADPVSQDICLEVTRGLEKHFWMVTAQLQ